MIIRIPNCTHAGIFGTTGGGKGTSFIIPHLLSHRGSMVVLDPQGSIYEATAEHRRKRFGHRIVRLDSSEICGPGGGGLNALDGIDGKAKTCLDQCKDVAASLVLRTGTEAEPHWPNSAENVIKVVTYFIATCETDPAQRNLLSMRRIVSSRDVYMACLNVMRQRGGLLAQQANSLKWLDGDELNSVFSTVNQHTAWMDSPATAEALRRSSFLPDDLRKEPMTVYVIESPTKLEARASQLRLYFATMLDVLTRGKASERSPVWFVIDETAALGRLKVLENAICTTRGYGIRLMLVYQSPAQLQQLYGDNARTVLDNLSTHIYVSMRSIESCEQISKSIGETTVDIATTSEQDGYSHPTGNGTQPGQGSRSGSTSVNYSQIARALFKPDEVKTAPDTLAWVFHKNLHVILARRLNYYDSPIFRKTPLGRRAGENRGLGLAGLAAALFLLLLSMLFSNAVTHLLRAAAH